MNSISNKEEKISVVMACYQGDRLNALAEAVDSVLEQTIPFYEFIIVVDGPICDEITTYLEQLNIKIDNVEIIYLVENKGAAVARNIGMKKSCGDYIAIMDSDDILYPERLEKQLNALQDKNVDGVWAWQEEFYDETNIFSGIKKCPEQHEDIISKLKFRCLLSDPLTFIKRECFETTGGYGDFKNINIDYKFFLKMMLHGYKFYCVQEVLIRVRVSKEQRVRRGGFALLKQDYKLRYWMFKHGIISLLEFLKFSVIFTIFRLQPNFMRDFLYKNILRKNK